MGTVGDIVEALEAIAPKCLAESWDNVGLQVGHYEWPVKRVGVALDASYDVIERASRDGVDLLVTHHPLIFRPLRSVNVGEFVGRAIQLALKEEVAVFSAHTNLDSARGGVNDMLAEKIGLQSVRVLRRSDAPCYRAAVYVPNGEEERVIRGLFDAGLGRGDKYSCLSFRTKGTGTFFPDDEASPAIGRRGKLNEVEEFRVEMLVREDQLETFREVLRRVHPYEEIVYDLYPVREPEGGSGLGRIGKPTVPGHFEAFVERLKSSLALSMVKTVGKANQEITAVAVCGGSGRSLIGDFLASGADVLVTGDVGYHDGQRVANAGKCLVDVGHFASEHIVVEGLCERLAVSLAAIDEEITVVPCPGERDCFSYR